MAANYLDIRHSHYRITLRGWLRGLDKALVAIASALTFILTAMVAMAVVGMAEALLLLSNPGTPPLHRAAVMITWQGFSFVLLRALREAALMPRARVFFDALPIPASQKLRGDVVLALLSYSFLWLPVAWALADPMATRAAPLAGTAATLTALVIISLCVNLTILRGFPRQAAVAVVALAGLALVPAQGFWTLPGCVALTAAAAASLWQSYLPGARRVPKPRRRNAHVERAALASGLVLPLLANELRANLAVRVGSILITFGACLLVIRLRTNDTSNASVLLFVGACAVLALYSLPALCRRTLLTKLHFLSGQPAFAQRMRLAAYAIPTALFCAALLLSGAFDHSEHVGVDAGVLAVLYVFGVAGARLEWRITTWVIPFATMIAVIVLGAMT